MYIKYENIIHNFDNYCDIVPADDNNNHTIKLVRCDRTSISLIFESAKIRDEIQKMIWNCIKNDENTFDIDEKIDQIIAQIDFNL